MREGVVIVMIVVDNPLAIFSWKLRQEGSQNIFCGYLLWGISYKTDNTFCISRHGQEVPHKSQKPQMLQKYLEF